MDARLSTLGRRKAGWAGFRRRLDGPFPGMCSSIASTTSPPPTCRVRSGAIWPRRPWIKSSRKLKCTLRVLQSVDSAGGTCFILSPPKRLHNFIHGLVSRQLRGAVKKSYHNSGDSQTCLSPAANRALRQPWDRRFRLSHDSFTTPHGSGWRQRRQVGIRASGGTPGVRIS